MRRKRWAKRLVLLLFSLVVCLFLVEGALRLRGVRPFPRVTDRSRFWQYDRELGWKHRPGQSDQFEMPDFLTRVSINQRGLRDEEHSYERSGDGERMLVLGDSFVWGFGVERENRFTEVLEEMAGLQTINAGVSGYCTDQELLWYRTEGVKYDVDHVLLVLTTDDLAQNHRDLVFYVYGKPRMVLDDGELVVTNVPVPGPPLLARLAHWFRCRSALFYTLSSERPPRAPRGDSPDRYRLTRALLDEIRKLAYAKGASFTIVLAGRDWWMGPEGESVEEFVTTLRGDGLRVLDIEAAPNFDPDRMIMPANGHWSEEGHEFLATKLLQLKGYLKQRKR